MTFPDQSFDDAAAYTAAYFERVRAAQASVDGDRVASAALVLEEAYARRSTLFVCGNGGSASISNHLVCDHSKLIQTDTNLLPKTVSLAANIEMITAIANDISYDDVFVYQLSTLAEKGDVLMTVSSSGESENVVRAAGWARDHGMDVIALTGFSGGRSSQLATVNVHVKGDNYGVIEDVHQSIMHLLGQYIRQSRMGEEVIGERKF